MIKFLAKYYKVIVHIIVWTMLFLIQINYFSMFSDNTAAFRRGIAILLIYLSIFYTNWFVFVPKLYVKKRYLAYILISLGMIVLFSLIRIGIEKHYKILPGILQRNTYFDKSVRAVVLSIGASLFIFFTSFFLRIVDYYNVQTRQKDQLLHQKTEAEIKLLKAQLNPHFLFNALNNIYALVLTRSENAAASLMSLSQLLRYIIYDAVVEKVSLEKEITYLNYYIELESLRLTNKNKLSTDISVKANDYKIMPMIFIPFVENSFKHSNINQDGHIFIKLHLNGNELEFICENTFSEKTKSVDHVGGIGLVNSKKRLEMVYPQKHKLSISKHDNLFSIILKIKL